MPPSLAKARHTRSYRSQATTGNASAAPIACAGDSAATAGSISCIVGWRRYSTANSAMPDSHVVYAFHFDHSRSGGSCAGAGMNFCLR